MSAVRGPRRCVLPGVCGVGGAVVGYVTEVLGGFRVFAQDGGHDGCGFIGQRAQPGSDFGPGVPLVPDAVPSAHGVGGLFQ